MVRKAYTIQYRKLERNANTTYIDISSIDKKYILDRLNEVNMFHDVCKKSKLNNEVVRIIRPNSNLLKMGATERYKKNSIYTAVNGILNNLRKGQRDLSEKTAKLISQVSNEMYKFIGEDYEVIEFVCDGETL